jgi:hypothetical protein
LSLRFPALTLELPSLHIPGLVRYRREPEMLLDETRAPYVYGPAAVYGQLLASGQAPYAAPGAPYAAQPPCNGQGAYQANGGAAASKSYSESLEREHKLQQQLLEKDHQIRQLELQNQKLRELEECLRRLTARQDELSRTQTGRIAESDRLQADSGSVVELLPSPFQTVHGQAAAPSTAVFDEVVAPEGMGTQRSAPPSRPAKRTSLLDRLLRR